MNKSFLYHVASDLTQKFGHDLSRTAVVFPNKRASLFMNECLVDLVDRPIWSPSYITISDLFRQHSTLAVADPIKLICDLHKSFAKCTATNETLDHFYGWGQLLLADFDDIDKNMADAKMIFANLRNIHELDDIAYLTDEQKLILKRFFSTFADDHESELKKRFLALWQHFGDIYDDFNQRLRSQGLAYEGALYREVAMDDAIDFHFERYVLVGFNMLQQVEQRLFKRLKQAGKAHFYWDFDRYYMPRGPQSNNEAGHYIAQYLKIFPNELDSQDAEIYDNMRRKKHISFVSASTENIQARFAGEWLKQGGKIADGKKTAIVMCDENLLQPVIYSLPPEVGKANITTGYPLKLSPIASFVSRLLDMQTMGHKPHSDKYSLHYINKLMGHPYMAYLSPKADETRTFLNDHKYYYPSRDLLAQDEALALLFAPMANETCQESDAPTANEALLLWAMSVVRLIGMNSREAADALQHESVFRMYTILSRLASLVHSGDLAVDVTTLRRLLRQVIDTTSVPFHGEPAVGVQVMGILETRNLDFDHVLLLSCNEGKMPQGVNDASFIPYSLRKAYGLTTIDNKVSIFSYYFHSLLQRASDITIAYNNSTDGTQKGEMSRFMLQLLVESGHDISLQSLEARNIPAATKPKAIEKRADVMAEICAMDSLSPSAINQYMRCQLQFYYNHVAHIKEPDDDDENKMDQRVFGNIFHKSAYYIYQELQQADGTVDKRSIEHMLKSPDTIERIVDQVFREELFKTDSKRFTPTYNGLQIINRKVIIGYLKQLLRIDSTLAPFAILALEQRVDDSVDISTSEEVRTVKVSGIIDRLDKVATAAGTDTIRVIDYKTGNKPSAKTKSLEEIFEAQDLARKHTDYFLQAMLYSIIVSRSAKWNKQRLDVSPALLFIRQSVKDGYDPTLAIDDHAIADIKPYADEFMDMLRRVLADIFDPRLPFSPTDDDKRCQTCPYKQICEA